MKTYTLNIKSHTEAPDFEYRVEAVNRLEAIVQFLWIMGGEVSEDMIAKNMGCDEECPDCHDDYVEKLETRDGRYFEEVQYCNGCGTTGTRKARA